IDLCYANRIDPQPGEIDAILDDGYAAWDDRQIMLTWPDVVSVNGVEVTTETIAAMYDTRILALLNKFRHKLIREGYSVSEPVYDVDGAYEWTLFGRPGLSDGSHGGFTVTLSVLDSFASEGREGEVAISLICRVNTVDVDRATFTGPWIGTDDFDAIDARFAQLTLINFDQWIDAIDAEDLI
ncbi:unnamed protein product, partial [marine sediment metagenome]